MKSLTHGEMKDVWLLAPPSGGFKKKTCTWREADTLLYFFTLVSKWDPQLEEP